MIENIIRLVKIIFWMVMLRKPSENKINTQGPGKYFAGKNNNKYIYVKNYYIHA